MFRWSIFQSASHRRAKIVAAQSNTIAVLKANNLRASYSNKLRINRWLYWIILLASRLKTGEVAGGTISIINFNFSLQFA
jgi:hypothetical protein